MNLYLLHVNYKLLMSFEHIYQIKHFSYNLRAALSLGIDFQSIPNSTLF